MNKFLKIIGAIVALAGIAAAIYFAVRKLTDKKSLNILTTTISLNVTMILKSLM